MAPHADVHPDLPLNLALAVITSSSAPLLLLDGKLAVIAASASFCRAFDIEPSTVSGCPVLALGAGEWAVAGLRTFLENTIAGQPELGPYEMELIRDGHRTRCLVLGARKLDYGSDQIRILFSVSDVTEIRAAQKLKDAMLEQKTVLLREAQHRIANSLQIIASVLMQSARQLKIGEARTHLQAAHGRLLSVAAVQQQLASSGCGVVEINAYLTQLCSSLSASMIADPEIMSIDVRADESSIDADASVSLGLIVTELVINALKHAFPDHKGHILVSYGIEGQNWKLSVTDNGIGMPTESTKPGLGTGIVEALAKQLDAEVLIASADPGTRVSIVHIDERALAPAAVVAH